MPLPMALNFSAPRLLILQPFWVEYMVSMVVFMAFMFPPCSASVPLAEASGSRGAPSGASGFLMSSVIVSMPSRVSKTDRIDQAHRDVEAVLLPVEVNYEAAARCLEIRYMVPQVFDVEGHALHLHDHAVGGVGIC